MEKRYSLVIVGLLCIVRIGLGQTTMPLSKPPLDRLVNGTQSTLSSIVDNTNYSSSAPEFNSRPEYINFIDPSSSSAGKYIPMKIYSERH